MDIAKQIVDQRLGKIINDYPEVFGDSEEKNISKAFLLLGIASYLDLEISEAEQYITDGSYDGGFDAAYIEENSDSQLNVVLFQSKYTRDLDKDTNFPANAVEKAVNTVKMVFDPSSTLILNDKSRKTVDEIRSFILDGKIPFVTFVMLNNGLAWTVDGQNCIDNNFKNQNQVFFQHFNHNDIIKYVTKNKSIATQFHLSGAATHENFNYKSVMIGRIAVSEIYSLMEQYGDALLEKNIRKYLGKNAVNNAIANTLLDDNKKSNFFFYNNGVTFICNKLSYNALQKQDWIVKVEGLQIINGGQTCKTIYQTIKENSDKDYSDVYVLMRLYELGEGENIIEDITYATNSQNPVDFRDLKSNDEKQVLLEKGAHELGYTYRRKREEGSSTENSIPIGVAASSVLAVWRDEPHVARYRKNDLFSSLYNKIFDNLNAAQMILAVKIFRFCDTMRKRPSNNASISALRPFSAHYTANILGKLLLEKNNLALKDISHKNFLELVSFFENNKNELYTVAENMLLKMISDNFGTKELYKLDGRTLAAPFRRFDLMLRYVNNAEWWKSYLVVSNIL